MRALTVCMTWKEMPRSGLQANTRRTRADQAPTVPTINGGCMWSAAPPRRYTETIKKPLTRSGFEARTCPKASTVLDSAASATKSPRKSSRRQEAEGRRQKAESRKQKAERASFVVGHSSLVLWFRVGVSRFEASCYQQG